MHLTLHLTEACNMNCLYCAQSHSQQKMSVEIACAAIDFAINEERHNQKMCDPGYTGICFFGGEPLLQRSIIEEVVAYCSELNQKTKVAFKFIVVTNGILLDDEFLRFACANHIRIDLSHDGLMHEKTRFLKDGSPSFELLEKKVDLLLQSLPRSTALCTIHPDYVSRMAESVDWLLDRGFKKVYTVPALGTHIDWNKDALEELKTQYLALSDIYIKRTIHGERFSLPVLDSKIRRHVMQNTIAPLSCRFGIKQLSVTPDGHVYPCLQFIKNKEFLMGHVKEGIDEKRSNYIIEQGKKESLECQACALKSRCRYNCCCQNMILTGHLDEVSSLTCALEKMTIEAADRAASILFEKKDSHFLSKHYRLLLDHR